MKYTGQLVTGDFEDNTMTFEIEGEMVLQSGKYSIEQIESGEQKKQATTPSVKQQRKLLDWLSDEPDYNIRKRDIDEILQDYNYYQSNSA